MDNKQISRRQAIKAVSQTMLGSILTPGFGESLLMGKTNIAPKYLFTVACGGGASIIDSFLAQTKGPAGYGDNQLFKPQGSPFSAVLPMENSIQGFIKLGNGYSQKTFLNKYAKDMVVMSTEVSSVNHLIAAKRAMSGDNINGGRTITEAIASAFGGSLPIPNVTMSGGGYADAGTDVSVKDVARPQLISDPLMMAFATHGTKAVTNMTSKEITLARELRADLEKISQYGRTFKNTPQMQSKHIIV